jgi:hypothetical protein
VRPKSCVLTVASTWNAELLPARDHVRFVLWLDAQCLRVQVDAPFFGDPAPPSQPGATPGLWNFEVVELFLLGSDDRYLELELSPHGHHLVLELHGRRSIVRSGMALDFDVGLGGDRWQGEARLPAQWLPRGLRAANAHSIHREGAARRYCSAHPDRQANGDPHRVPDFHRLECFEPLVWSE